MSPPAPKLLPPLTQPIALDPTDIASSPTSLIITETVSGYDFTITDRSTSKTLYTVKGRTDSRHAYKDVFSSNDTHIFSLVKENKSLPKHYALLKPDGTEWLPVEHKWGTTVRQTSSFPNMAKGATHPATLTISASYFSRNGDFVSVLPAKGREKEKEEVAAHVFRDFYTWNEWMKAKRTYYLDVAPGMDVSVAIGSMLYLHERINEGADKRGGSDRGMAGAIAGGVGGAAGA